jgi:hypothetical protein
VPKLLQRHPLLPANPSRIPCILFVTHPSLPR